MRQFYRKSGNDLRIFFSCLGLFLIRNLCLATPPQQNEPIERIILNLTQNPENEMAVTWRTGPDTLMPQAQIALAMESMYLSEISKTEFATTVIVRWDSVKIVHYHSVFFDSLQSNTLYAYRVGNGSDWSEWNQFKTASENPEPFKFVYLSDPQNNIKSMCSRIFRAAYKKAPDADFWLFTGDLVDIGYDDQEWAELYYALGWIPRMTPMILVPGNHGYYSIIADSVKSKHLTPLWRPQFTLPENGPDGLEETAYSIDYQGVRFVMLNGNEKLEEQAEWLDKILSDNPRRWTIAAIHQPFYSTGLKRDNPDLRMLFVPIFDKYSVDLVLQGHDHTYGRTHSIRNGIRVDDNQKGTVYVVSVSGPKVYPVNPRHKTLMAKMGTGMQLFQVITVDKNLLKYESRTATGALYDHFELRK